MIELQQVEQLKTANQLAYYRLLTDSAEVAPLSDRVVETLVYLQGEFDRKLGPPPNWTPPQRPSGRP